jgi:hypothetical protein
MPYLLLTLACFGRKLCRRTYSRSGRDPILMTEARWALTAMVLVLLYHRQIHGKSIIAAPECSNATDFDAVGRLAFP